MLQRSIFLPLALVAQILWTATAPAALAQSESGEIANPSPRSVVAVVPRSWPPQYQVDRNGKPIGFAIDVMDEVAARAGLTVTYVVAENFSTAVDILRQGNADLIPNSGILPKRMDEFAFTAPVETFVVSLFVREDSVSITGVADLPGRRLAVVEKNVGLHMFGERQDIDIRVYPDVRSALFELIAGHVDALVYPRPTILYLAREAGIEDRIKGVGRPLQEVKRGIRVMKGEVALLAVLNAAVEDFVATSAYQRIYTKWYGSRAPYWAAAQATWVMGALILLVLIAMAWWRYRSVLTLNRDLRKSIEEREGAEAKFESILRISADAIISVDEHQTIRLFNQGAEATFGYSADEVLGKSLGLLLPNRYGETHPAQVAAFGSTAAVDPAMKGRREILGLRKDGTEFPAEASASKLNLGGEKIFTVTLVDVSKRREAEKAIRQARENAETLNRAKSEFLAAMSHELRTPLNAIIGFSEIIQNEMLGPVGSTKYRDYADDINESGQYLLDLINDILDLSKVESGTDELHEENIEVSEVIHTVVVLVQQRAKNQGVKVVSDTPDGLPGLRADKRKLKQILVNLLTNAIKFTEAGGEVRVETRCRPESGWEFEIVDTGIGMAAEDFPKALSQFGQVDSDLDRPYEGTGLGLPLTKALSELHGGRLDLHSEVGKGTTVTIWFPAERIVPSDQESIRSA
jgi:PAS domain S-box-containing protein